VAVSTQEKPGEPDFANAYYKLVELYAEDGRPIPFTCGIPNPQAEAWYARELADSCFPDRGFMFDFGGNFANSFDFNVIDTTGRT